jgi:hypothetical protein|tara:strand:- start:8587 stop:8751 length:165 start_codon:yes stop_codon:yes gene_type:complete
MALTIADISDRLKHLDEITLLEVLDISSEDLVERFQDLIEDRAEELEEELRDDD